MLGGVMADTNEIKPGRPLSAGYQVTRGRQTAAIRSVTEESIYLKHGAPHRATAPLLSGGKPHMSKTSKSCRSMAISCDLASYYETIHRHLIRCVTSHFSPFCYLLNHCPYRYHFAHTLLGCQMTDFSHGPLLAPPQGRYF